jgi:hypothetical protein
MQKISKFQMNIVKRAACLAAGMVYCAGVLAAPPPPPVYTPDILVTGMNTAIYDGTVQPLKLDGTYFGQAQLGVNSWEHAFEIRNFGTADLLLTDLVSVTGANAGDFVITQQPLNRIAPGQRTSFSIRYTPSFVGNAYATVVVPSNDPDETSYDFTLRGDGVDTPLVGPDLSGELVFYKNYKCQGIPLLYCKMNGRVDVQNLSTTYDLNWATVRVYVVNGDILNDQKYLVAEKTVKKLKAFKPGKKNKAKRVKFKGYVPPGYTHIYAEVVPEDGSEDINYTNNRTAYLYGL